MHLAITMPRRAGPGGPDGRDRSRRGGPRRAARRGGPPPAAGGGPRRDAARRGAELLAAGGAGAAGAYLLDPRQGRRRRHVLRDRATAAGRRGVRRAERGARYAASRAAGLARRARAALRRPARSYDDVTLARKVQTVLFRPADAPKGAVNVAACDGVVELRGAVARPEQVAALGRRAAKVDGVREVRNLLHVAGTPAPHAPPSDPAEVRARAARMFPAALAHAAAGAHPGASAPPGAGAPAAATPGAAASPDGDAPAAAGGGEATDPGRRT